MPYQYEQYRPSPSLPYVQYRSPYTGTLAQLVGSSDRANAAIALASGEASARIAQNIGQGVNQTLGDILKYKQYQAQHADAAQIHEIRQQQIDAARQKIEDDQTLTNVMSGSGHVAGTQGSFPVDEAGQPIEGGEFQSTAPYTANAKPSREEILQKLPAHLQSTATKMFEENDKLARDAQTSKLALDKAMRDKTTAVNEHLAHLGYVVARAKGDPTVTKFSFDEARKAHADDPDVLKKVDELEGQLGDFQDPATNLRVGTYVAGLSDKFRAELEKPARTRLVESVDKQGNPIQMIVPDEAGMSYKKPGPKLGSQEYDIAAYATSIGKQPGEQLTFAEIQKFNALEAASKHIEAGDKLTPQQHQDLVASVLKHPALFLQMPAATKQAITPALDAAGFTQFGGGLSAAGLMSAGRWRDTAIQKAKADLDGAELKSRLVDIEGTYQGMMSGQTPVPVFKPTPFTIPGAAPAAAPSPRPPLAEGALPTLPPRPAAFAAPTVPGIPADVPAGGGTTAPGMLVPGNINLANRPQVQNPDGSVSTVRSIGVNIDGKEVLIPTVVNGRVVSNAEAIAEYKRTGQHLGMFDTPEHSTQFAQALHESEAAKLQPPTGGPPAAPPAPVAKKPLPPPSPDKFQLKVGNQMLQFPNKAAAQAWAKSHGMVLQ